MTQYKTEEPQQPHPVAVSVTPLNETQQTHNNYPNDSSLASVGQQEVYNPHANTSAAPPSNPNLSTTQTQASPPIYPARYYPSASASNQSNTNDNANNRSTDTTPTFHTSGIFASWFGSNNRKSSNSVDPPPPLHTSDYQPMKSNNPPAVGPLPPPYPNSGNPYSSIPPGWSTMVDPHDGRIYYYEPSTGRTSSTHPLAAPTTNNNNSNSSSTQPPSATQMMLLDHQYNKNNPNNEDWTMMMHADHNPRYAHRRPDNHQCSAVASLVLCFPLGIFAMYHSWQTDVAWKAGRYGDAVNHARQTPQYAGWGIALGGLFWVLWFFFKRGNDQWKWPEWGNLFND